MGYLNKKDKLLIGIAVIILVIISGTVYMNQQKSGSIILAEEKPAESERAQAEEQEDSGVRIEVEETGADITVYICGAVKASGNITVKKDTRLGEALSLMGGPTEEADLERINLAVKLEDEDYIYIPYKDEKAQTQETQVRTTKGQVSGLSESKGFINGGETANGKININTATQAELEKLPGVGPSTAQKIIGYRQENGKFQKPEDLKKVTGIGDKKYEKLREHIIAE